MIELHAICLRQIPSFLVDKNRFSRSKEIRIKLTVAMLIFYTHHCFFYSRCERRAALHRLLFTHTLRICYANLNGLLFGGFYCVKTHLLLPVFCDYATYRKY